MVCKFCGKILEDGSKFCNGCGGMLSDMPSPSEKKAPLDSLINDIDSMEIDENGDFVTVAYTENSEIDATVPITALDDKKVEYNPVNKPSTPAPVGNGNGSNNKKNNTPIIIAIVAIVVAIIMLVVAVVAILGSSPSNEVDDDTTTEAINEDITVDVETEPETETETEPETETSSETTTEKETETTTKAEISTATVQKEIDNALNSRDIRQVQKVIAKYMPLEDYSVYRTYTPQQEVILDTLINFYITVDDALSNCEFHETDEVYMYLHDLYGDIIIDDYGNMQYPWMIGNKTYAVTGEVSRYHHFCYQTILWHQGEYP